MYSIYARKSKTKAHNDHVMIYLSEQKVELGDHTQLNHAIEYDMIHMKQVKGPVHKNRPNEIYNNYHSLSSNEPWFPFKDLKALSSSILSDSLIKSLVLHTSEAKTSGKSKPIL